jgi:acyl-CoA thioester hydrolase
MIISEIQLRPRYDEVDKMGYVYHANHVCYCHQARTELLRKFGINDSMLESKNVMIPVISFEIKYHKPAHYDELLTIRAVVRELPEVRFNFEFEIFNENRAMLSQAKSTVVFVNSQSRFPMEAPEFVQDALKNNFKEVCQ